MAYNRLSKELRDFNDNQPFNCSAGLTEENDIFHWQCAIIGPENTPYENGVFYIDVIFPNTYPYSPPTMKLLTKIYHPNISESGHIGLNCLNKWTNSYSIKKILYECLLLLKKPIENNCYNKEIYNQYLNNNKLFNSIAKEWTEKYAI